jgi:hypothetical protein
LSLQNRFIVFDERLRPGPFFEEEGVIFDHAAFHNIPGYQDNWRVRPFSDYRRFSS